MSPIRGSTNGDEKITGTIGIDPNRTILWAQVNEGQPQMSIDSDLRLRPRGIAGNSSVYLGDVGRAALRSLGPADPPVFEELPGYDEQKWIMITQSGDIKMKIISRSYWGFGLISTCFLNRIEITGPLSLRARIIHDIAASLGRNPWESKFSSFFTRHTGATSEEHRVAWEGLIERAREEMNDDIIMLEEKLNSLKGISNGIENIDDILEEARISLDEARLALADHNAPAVERALGRVTSSLIEADPKTEIRSSESLANQGNIDSKREISENSEVDASHLLEDIPLVDLTEEESQDS